MAEVAKNIDHNQLIDHIEDGMFSMVESGEFEFVDCPVTHRFTDGLYVREIFMKAGCRITSLIHKTEHPYFILQGKVSVFSENFGEQLLESPYIGTTLPNTRRVLLVHEDCVWATVHKTDIKPTDNTEEAILAAVSLIAQEIIEPHENILLEGQLKNNKINNISSPLIEEK